MRLQSKVFLFPWFVWAALLSAGMPRPAEAQGKGDASTSASASIMVNEAKLEFRTGNKEAALYEFGPSLFKPYFWPLEAPNGRRLTRAWPMLKDGPDVSRDHPHQKSGWFCHGDVIPVGMELKRKVKGVEGIDFWSESANAGRIVCTRVGEAHNEGNRARITTHNEWRTADGEKVLDETRTIQFFDHPTARLFVVDSDLHASVVPIVFGDTKEGAFGVRVADSIREDKPGKGVITNAEGKTGERQCWGRISSWCDYSGPVQGDTVGIAIFASPDNPIPSCWHARAYGLMAANPFGRAKSGFPDMKDKKDEKDLAHLDKGEHLKLRYALFLHLGDVKEGKVAENYELFKKLK
jgi:hypothetical protein